MTTKIPSLFQTVPVTTPGGVVHCLLAVTSLVCVEVQRVDKVTDVDVAWVYHFAAAAHNRVIQQFPVALPPATEEPVTFQLARADVAIGLVGLTILKDRLLESDPGSFLNSLRGFSDLLTQTPSVPAEEEKLMEEVGLMWNGVPIPLTDEGVEDFLRHSATAAATTPPLPLPVSPASEGFVPLLA